MLQQKEQQKSGGLRRNSSVGINETRIAGLYDLEHTIGKGHFAVVKLARHVFTGEKVAVKVIDKTKLDKESAADLMQEVRCMKLVQHPNIVRLYEVIDTQTKLFLILELGDYDMHDYIMRVSERGGCKEAEAQQYFSQIIKAIDYCHMLHVVHRDLKPENVVFFEKLGMVKLTDFGWVLLNSIERLIQLSTSCGSLAYSAPEILLGDAYDAPAVDIWSLGVILYMLVCGRLPFQEANESETLTRILDCRYSIPDGISAACKELIQKMLVRDPTKRATLDFITKSPWVRAGDRGHAEVLPLLSRTNLSDFAHNTIVEQMVAGGIGSEDHILDAIEQGEYSYLTATYYLLAERVLAAQRVEQATRLRDTTNTTAFPEEEEQAASGSHQPTNVNRSRSNSWRGPSGRRACTILKEESEEELSTYLRSSSRQSSRFFTKRDNVASRAASLESFRSGGGPPILEAADSLDADSVEGADERRAAGKKLSIIQADDDEEDEENRPLVDEEAPSSHGSPKVTSGGLGFTNSFAFDELSPIRELMEANFGGTNASESSPGTDREAVEGPPEEPLDDELPPTRPRATLSWQRAVSSSDEDERRGLVRRRRFNSSRSVFKNPMEVGESPLISRTPSAPVPINQLAPPAKFSGRRFKPPMERRNSSPSVAMFGPTGLRSSCDRISPQQVNELLQFSRLSGKRAASPESRISSRSPSPPCSSGRASPSVSSISMARLKATNLLASGSAGMRKMSSSPHLSGIFEEMEETTAESHSSTFYTVQSHKTSFVSSGASLFTVGAGDSHSGKLNGALGRGMRSASTGFTAVGRPQKSLDSELPVLPERASSAAASNPPHSTFSALRTRPRTGMSPDLGRRFEQHTRFVARTKRSTSCSSSETSEDDTNERRLNLIQTHCRRHNSDDRPRPDDEPPGSGTQPKERRPAGAAGSSTSGPADSKTSAPPPASQPTGDQTNSNQSAGLVQLRSLCVN